MRDRLEEIKRSDQEKLLYLAYLIEFNSKYGLKRFYEIIRANMKITDDEDNSYINSLANCISDVNDPDLWIINNNSEELIDFQFFQEHDLLVTTKKFKKYPTFSF